MLGHLVPRRSTVHSKREKRKVTQKRHYGIQLPQTVPALSFAGQVEKTEHRKTEQQYYKRWVNHSPPSARVAVHTIRNVCWSSFS